MLRNKLKEFALTPQERERIITSIEALDNNSPEVVWQHLIKEIVNLEEEKKEKFPFALHLLLYKTIYPTWDKIPAPAWFPDLPHKNHNTHPNHNDTSTANLTTVMQQKNIQEYVELHRWSVEHREAFWTMVVKVFPILFDTPYSQGMDLTKGVEFPQWFPGATLNIANSCFTANETDIAIIEQNEAGALKNITYGELNRLSNRVANALSERRYDLKKGDCVAIIMPMHWQSVAIYLGIIKAGMVCVSIADSFAGHEIGLRLKIANTKAIFTQDCIVRNQKILPLYSKIVAEPEIPFMIVLSEAVELTSGKNFQNKPSGVKGGIGTLTLALRAGDIAWNDFIHLHKDEYTHDDGSPQKKEYPLTDEHPQNDVFSAVSCLPSDPINILFSSGTTGDPKAIPWTHTTPIKCASDAFFHHNIKPNDKICWPTSLGWMMGPWLIFAALLNKATIALYTGTPNGRDFGEFVQNRHINILGVVPTLVKHWRDTQCMEGLHWNAINLFTSTGECSNTEDMLYLMWLAGYRPIIEYCGGTEIGGAYITGTVLQPASPAAFTTPAMGLDIAILNEKGDRATTGEVAIIPPSIGLSVSLINQDKDHHTIYYSAMPTLPDGKIVRRHGDEIIQYKNGYYRLHGRVDDTMNLSGIKISALEIERILSNHPSIYETAAIAVPPKTGGPDQLVIYAVLKTEGHKETTLEKEGKKDKHPRADKEHKEAQEEHNAHNIINKAISDEYKRQLKHELQDVIKQQLNPLFKIHDICIIEKLYRTASNKVMRRVLRDEYKNKLRSQ